VFEREVWLFINSFADWLSALGTIAAVITALYLARRDSRISLRVLAGIRMLLGGNLPTDRVHEFVCLEITNVGRRQARVSNIYFRDGFPWGSKFVMIPPKNIFSSAVPIMLADGETASYVIPVEEFEQVNQGWLKKHFAGTRGRVRARLFRAGVVASAGGMFDVRVEDSLRRRLAEWGGHGPQKGRA
jgi:hypothetical protein